nr:hypothetical protein [Tanacetum cinerariifolium]
AVVVSLIVVFPLPFDAFSYSFFLCHRSSSVSLQYMVFHFLPHDLKWRPENSTNPVKLRRTTFINPVNKHSRATGAAVRPPAGLVTDTIKKGQNPSKTGQNRARNGKRGKVNSQKSTNSQTRQSQSQENQKV